MERISIINFATAVKIIEMPIPRVKIVGLVMASPPIYLVNVLISVSEVPMFRFFSPITLPKLVYCMYHGMYYCKKVCSRKNKGKTNKSEF